MKGFRRWGGLIRVAFLSRAIRRRPQRALREKKEFRAELAKDAEVERNKTVANSNVSATRKLLTAPKRQPMIVYI